MSHYNDVMSFRDIAEELGSDAHEVELVYKRAMYKLTKEKQSLANLQELSEQRKVLACQRVEPYGENEI